nr:P8 [Oat sterile dwarf virus]
MEDLHINVEPDLSHCGMSQRLSEQIILNDRPTINLLMHAELLFKPSEIIKCPTTNRDINEVTIHAKTSHLRRFHDRLSAYQLHLYPNLLEFRTVTTKLFESRIIDNNYFVEVNQPSMIGFTRRFLALFAMAKVDVQQLENQIINTLTKGNLALKSISADGAEMILDSNYVNIVKNLLGNEIVNIIHDCQSDAPAEMGISTVETEQMIKDKTLRLDGGYDYNGLSVSTDITTYGNYNQLLIQMFMDLKSFFNLTITSVTVDKLAKMHVLPEELSVLDLTKSLIDQKWIGNTQFNTSTESKTPVGANVPGTSNSNPGIKTDDKSKSGTPSPNSSKAEETEPAAEVVSDLKGKNKAGKSQVSPTVQWYQSIFNNPETAKYVKLVDSNVLNESSGRLVEHQEYLISSMLFENLPLSDIENTIIISFGDRKSERMTMAEYRSLSNTLNKIWKRGKDLVVKASDYLKIGLSKASHLADILEKKYNITLTDVYNFIMEGPSYFNDTAKWPSPNVTAKGVILNVIPAIIQSLYKEDESSVISNSELIRSLHQFIADDSKRLSEKNKTNLRLEAYTAEEALLPKIIVRKPNSRRTLR